VHPIIGLEELSPQGQQLAVGWMIQRLHACDSLRKLRVRLPDVRGELSFGVRRPGDENRSRFRNGVRNTTEEVRIHLYMPAVASIGLVMDVLVWM